MSLNYEKLKKKQESSGDFWTSYSDLATVISVLFLLLYAVAILRNQSVSVSERISAKRAQQEIETLQEQINAYEILKQEYLENGASQRERKMYEELLGQMQLMESQAREEKEQAQRTVAASTEKEKGLNKYQAMIKNIITANMIAQSTIKKRDNIIIEKTKSVDELSKIASDREDQIAQNNREITNIQKKLEESISEVKNAYRSKARSKKKLREEIARLQAESTQKVQALQNVNTEYAQQLDTAKSLITEKQRALEDKSSKLQQAQAENTKIMGELEQRQKNYQDSISRLQASNQQKLNEERKQFEESLNREKLTAQAKLEREQAYREKVERDKQAFNTKLNQLEGQLEETKQAIAQKEAGYRGSIAKLSSAKQGLEKQLSEREAEYQGSLSKLSAEKSRILGELEKQQGDYQASIGKLEQDYQSKLGRERAEFEASLNREKLGAQARAAREAAYRAKVDGDRAAYDAKMRELGSQLEGTRKAIADKEAQYKGSLEKLASAKQGLERELSGYKGREEARREVSERIRRNFAKAGINASINSKTGEVTIHFGEEYFDYGSSSMKEGMIKVLQKAIPTYAQSLFADPKLAEKIANVEIIGFASPTYRGKYVNPKDLSPGARAAVNYNMDLSYQRAKSIFEYVFNPKAMNYERQRDLLQLTKVSGLSYLRSQGATEAERNLTDDQYCDKYDCTKSQKVIIKFNFQEK